MPFSTGGQRMNRRLQGGGDCPTQAEGAAFLKCFLKFLNVNNEKL